MGDNGPMRTVNRWCGYVHILLGVAVAVQFVASPTYDLDASGDVWDVLVIPMAVGAASAVVFSLIRVQQSRESEEGADLRSVCMLIASAALFLLYYRLWLAWWVFDAAETPPADLRQVMWYFIDVLFVLVSIAVGRHLLRAAGGQEGRG